MGLQVPIAKLIKTPTGTYKIKIDIFNRRIKIIKFLGSVEDLLLHLHPTIEKYNTTKLIYISPKKHIKEFKDKGFIMEAKIDGFYNGVTGYILSKFIGLKRKMTIYTPEEEEVLIKAREYINKKYTYKEESKFTIRTANKNDAKELAMLYDKVFKTYPTPMDNENFIKRSMDQNVLFKIVLYENKIISSASADMDLNNLNAEMTDCVTLPEYRGKDLMGKLLYKLEEELVKNNFKVLYSIARAISLGMNIVFSKHNYKYSGRLVNNCNICGRFEDMNMWVKNLKS